MPAIEPKPVEAEDPFPQPPKTAAPPPPPPPPPPTDKKEAEDEKPKEEEKPKEDLVPRTDSGEAIFSKMDTVVQNEQPTLTEHPGSGAFIKHIALGMNPCSDEEKPKYGSTDDMVNALALHEMATGSDPLLHQKLKEHLLARKVQVVVE